MNTTIKTSDIASVRPFLKQLYIPQASSHKGQNGKVMIIGGSSLFHSAVIWSAEVASYFVDMVHFASTAENNTVMHEIKKKWHNGIVVSETDIPLYISEDDAVLLGTGMERESDEGKRTRDLTERLLKSFPEKRWVLDAGTLQTMDPQWLLLLSQKPILTPHQREFSKLFKVSIPDKKKEKIQLVEEIAKKYQSIILLKAGFDIVSDGQETVVIEGGNAGLTKGGTGDILAGITVSLYAKNNGFQSAILGSYVLKLTADMLYEKKGYWYNTNDIIPQVSEQLFQIVSQ